MKRSEMIELITDIIHHHPELEGEWRRKDSKVVAIDVLDMIESEDMLPPNCTVIDKDGKHTPTERRWDNENEAK